MSAPLAGLRVVEVADGLGAAIAGRLFAALGADVVLVEPPETGSGVRRRPPFLGDEPGPERSGLFLFAAAGKRSAVLDLGTEEGREALDALLDRADLLVEDRGRELDFLARAAEGRPRLTTLSLSPFGLDGPCAAHAAVELAVAARGGWMVQLGEPGREPLVTASETTSAFVPGHFGAIAAMAAVLAGGGRRVDVAASEALLAATRYNETYFHSVGTEIRRSGRSFGGWTPTYRIFEAADGWVTCAASTDAQVESLMRLAGVEDERFATREGRYGHADAFVAALQAWFGSKTRDEIFHEAQSWRIPMGKVTAVDEVLELEQLAARGFFAEVEHPVLGRRRVPGEPVWFGGEPRPAPRRAPLLGEHTEEVLAELRAAGTARAEARRRDAGSRVGGASVGLGLPLAGPPYPQAVDEPFVCVRTLLGPDEFEGVRILDLTLFWAGPLPTAVLADLGAEVLKIESTTHVDPFRAYGTPVDGRELAWERSPLFNAANRNKRSVTLDLATPDGRDLFLRLAAKSDAVLQNYSPRVLGQLGLSYEELREVNPRIVLASVSGFGQDGPWRDYVSFAAIGEALAGVSALSGYAGEGPVIHGVGVSDPYAGLTAGFALLAAVRQASRTGRGAAIDVSQLEATIPFLADAFLDWSLNGRRRERTTNGHPTRSPHGAFPARGEDQWLAVSVGEDREWRGLALAAGRPRWAEDRRFATAAGRLEHRAELDRTFAGWTAERDKHEAAAALQAKGVPAEPVLSPREQLEDPHLRARGFFQWVDHPVAGRHPYPSLPARIDGAFPPIRRVGPMLGEDTEAVLGELLGLGAAELARLREAGVIGNAPKS